jgi:hypothetical protein
MLNFATVADRRYKPKSRRAFCAAGLLKDGDAQQRVPTFIGRAELPLGPKISADN